MKKLFQALLGFGILSGICFLAFWLMFKGWEQVGQLKPEISVPVFTAALTVFISTLTFVWGKQIERKIEVEAHYRDKKTEIYNEFLTEFFRMFDGEDDEDDDTDSDEMVKFLREWQRKIIIWAGQDVFVKYIEWMSHLKRGEPDARTLYLMGEFFIAMRTDLGHKNDKIKKGDFSHLILRNAEIFLEAAKSNPDITFKEFAEIEESLLNSQNLSATRG